MVWLYTFCIVEMIQIQFIVSETLIIIGDGLFVFEIIRLRFG